MIIYRSFFAKADLQMYRRAGRKPDFFAVVVLLVMVGFGLTVAAQLVTSEVDQVVESLPTESVITSS